MVYLNFFACGCKDPDPDPYRVQTIMDPDPNGPKTYGSYRPKKYGSYGSRNFLYFFKSISFLKHSPENVGIKHFMFRGRIGIGRKISRQALLQDIY
jgi:hypothetical protein